LSCPRQGLKTYCLMKNSICFLAFFLSVTFCFATASTAPDLACPAPKNVTKVSETPSSISFDWDDCCNSQSFLVYYVKDGVTSGTYQVSSSDISFTGLSAGVYEFHFSSVCLGATSAEIIITEDIVEV